MATLPAILKSKNILLAITLVVLIFLVIFLSAFIKITWLMRIVIIAFLILIFVIVFLFKKMKEIQKAGQIEQSISSSSNSHILSPEKRAEIDQFRKQIEAAITALKNSKLGRGKSGKAALYKLPWYMIIGPSAAGKTTAIQNSGLEFPYGKDSIKGVGGTRNCDWFFSTRAIFLDTAGRYISESEDRPEWLAFLETLKKNRKRKPVNGIVIALNIDEIVRCENDQLNEHAQNIRRRIDELIENLGIVFPVYFIFTKCDLIQGFVEFFGDFSEIERSQIWGATLTSQQQLDPNPKSVFENEFDKLAEVIHKARTIRLSNPLKREQRRKVFLFPFQFKSLREKLTYLIGEVFQPNPYQDNPLFRGFYFTSGTQEGIPLDLAIREIAKKFNLPPAPGEEFEEMLETKNYFIKDLLNDVVINDQNYAVGQAAAVVKQNRFVKFATLSVSALIVFVFGILITMGFWGSSDAMKRVTSQANSFNELNLMNGDLLNNFAQVESLKQTILKIGINEYNESIISFGMDRTNETLEPLTKLYLEKTESFFNKYIYEEIVNTLENYTDFQEYSSEQIHDYLKAYLLIGSERSKLDTVNQKFLAKFFTGILDVKFIESNPKASTKDKDSLRVLFRNYTTYISELMKDEKVYPYQSKNALIGIVRMKLNKRPTAESIYTSLKENGYLQFSQELTLEKLIEGKSGLVIYTDLKIPYIFSADGWKNYFQSAILNKSINPDSEDWVTGKPQVKQPPQSELDSEKLKSQLTHLYQKEFTQRWVQFIQSLKYSGFGSVANSANNLKLLSDPGTSPLVLVFKVFINQLDEIVGSPSLSDSSNNTQYSLSSSIIADYDRFRKFIIGSTDGSVPSDLNYNVIKQYGLLYNIFEQVKEDRELIRNYAANVTNQRAPEFQNANNAIIGSTYNVQEFQSLLLEPIKQSLNSVFYEATSSLNEKWKKNVVDVFNRSLANSFPFSVNGVDAPILDFDEFFNPQGILWSFFDSELSAFIKKEDWLSKEFITAFNKVNDIKTILYKGGNLNFSFRLKPQQPVVREIEGKKPAVIQYCLKIDGVEEFYKMGSSYETFYSWPKIGSTPGAVLYVTLDKFGNSEIKSFEGEWALFRLLNAATITAGDNSSQILLNWNFSKQNQYDVDVKYIMNVGSSKHPFSKNFFNSFKLPDKIN